MPDNLTWNFIPEEWKETEWEGENQNGHLCFRGFPGFLKKLIESMNGFVHG